MTTSGSGSSSKSIATLTVLGRLRGTPYLWVFLLTCTAFTAIALAQLTAVRKELSAGELNFSIQRRFGIPIIGTHNASTWPTMATGDELIGINGEFVTVDDFFRVRTALPVGPLRVKLRRDGVVFEAQGEVTALKFINGSAVAMRWLIGVLLYLLAAGVFLLRPGAKVSWLFYLFLSEVGSMVLLQQGFPAPLSVAYGFLGLLFLTAPVVGFHFFSNFPSEWSAQRFAPAMYVVALVLFAGSLFVTASGLFAVEVISTVASLTRTFSIISAVPVLLALVHQYRFARAQKDERLIEVTRTLTLASVGGLFVPLVANTLVRTIGMEGGIAHQITAIAVLFFGVTTAMVLVRHNPLEIDRYAASVVGYVVTLGGLGGVFAILLFTLPLILKSLGFANSSEALVGVTALIFASVGPVYRRLRKSVDRWFSLQQADALQTAEVVRRIADSVQNDSREKSLATIVDAGLIIGAQLVALWQIDASGRSLHRIIWRNGKPDMFFVPRVGAIERALEKAGGVEGLAPNRFPPDTQQALWELDLAMSAPVRAHGVPMGFLGVGRRLSGFGYRSEDLSFLETLASQAGLALERGSVVTQIGRYRVEKRLAQGGMAEVFIAWQLGPGGFERKVALKRLLPELAEDPRSAAGLLDEARITARLQHGNIAQVYEVGLEQGQHFIAMEFVDGPPLRTLCANQRRANQPTPLPIALSIAQGLLAALEHAHQLTDENGKSLGVVHRDVTPANVLVSNRGETKLVDFGLVMASTRLFRTQTGVARGTVPFMSPEQALHDENIDSRSDIYSAAATLYELFSGDRAFPDGPIGTKAPMPISSVNPLLPRGFDAVFEKAFASEKTRRYESAMAFWLALAAATHTAPASPSEVASWVAKYRAQPDAKAQEGTQSFSLPNKVESGSAETH